MSSPRLICKLCLLLFCFMAIGTGNFSFAQSNELTITDTIQTEDHYLDRQIVFTGHLGKLLFLPSHTKLTISPRFYFKSNYFSKEIWGGIMGTGITAGLNYILFPYMAFSPEWRRNHVFINIALGGQLAIGGSMAGIGIGLLPFGGIGIGYNSYPLSKTFTLNAEVGVNTFIILGNPSPMYPYLNLGLVYRRNKGN